MLQFASTLLMLIYCITKNRFLGFASWTLFGFFWLLSLPYYLRIEDYFNSLLVISAFVLFSLIGATIFKNNERVFVRLTYIAALSSLIYFSFAETWLGRKLIEVVAQQTVFLASLFGYDFSIRGDVISYRGKLVQIILACTGIESISLFTGIALGADANVRDKIKAFLVSAPVIYVLNLFRNFFIIAAYGDEWFGEMSFYLAHHVISKFLATVALILIAMQVFKYLPKFAEDVFEVKDLVVRTWLQRKV